MEPLRLSDEHDTERTSLLSIRGWDQEAVHPGQCCHGTFSPRAESVRTLSRAGSDIGRHTIEGNREAIMPDEIGSETETTKKKISMTKWLSKEHCIENMSSK